MAFARTQDLIGSWARRTHESDPGSSGPETLARNRRTSSRAPAFWSAPVLWRFPPARPGTSAYPHRVESRIHTVWSLALNEPMELCHFKSGCVPPF